MIATIINISPNTYKDKDGNESVYARFYWDGRDRSVRVPAGACKVGDDIIVVLEERFNKEKKQDMKWWSWKGVAK